MLNFRTIGPDGVPPPPPPPPPAEGCWDPRGVACQRLTALFLWTGVQEQLCLGCTCCSCQVVIFEKLLVVQDTQTHTRTYTHSHCVSLCHLCIQSGTGGRKEWGGCVVDSSHRWQSGECGKLYSRVLMKMRTPSHRQQSNTSTMQVIFAPLWNIWRIWCLLMAPAGVCTSIVFFLLCPSSTWLSGRNTTGTGHQFITIDSHSLQATPVWGCAGIQSD